jgi:hypothetical protein
MTTKTKAAPGLRAWTNDMLRAQLAPHTPSKYSDAEIRAELVARGAALPFSYDAWITEQAAEIETECTRLVRCGRTPAVYLIPAAGPTPGRLICSDEQPQDATDVVRFPVQGSAVGWVPRPHLRSLLWDACRGFPVLPIDTATPATEA